MLGDILFGGLLVGVVGSGLYSTGVFRGYANGKRKFQNKQPKLICHCEHPLGMHDNGKVCNGELPRKVYSKAGDGIGYNYVGCRCLQYTGPPAPLTFTYNDLMLGGKDSDDTVADK